MALYVGNNLIRNTKRKEWEGYDHTIKVTPLSPFDDVLTHGQLSDLAETSAPGDWSFGSKYVSADDKPENRGPKPSSFLATWWPLFAAGGALAAIFLLTRKKGKKRR